MKAHLIMPMGGSGKRFSEKGFLVPKPMLEISDKPFFYWATESIRSRVPLEDITFVVLREHIEQHDIDRKIREYYPEANIVELKEVLPGAVYTCLEGIKNINDDNILIFNDCDHLFLCSELEEEMKKSSLDADGLLLSFNAKSDNYSYIKYDCGKMFVIV